MEIVMIIAAAGVPLLLALAFNLGRLFQRVRRDNGRGEEVSRQHLELFQGGDFNEAAVERAKDRFRDLLERGDEAAVEASLRPGTQYVFQVRALAEIGTDSAGQILERQLQRRLSDDHVEQAWYWIDLASNLRALNRPESLPYLLRCAETTTDPPLGHFFAAETVCFLGFGGFLREPESPLGQSAQRVLQRALEGQRFGIQPHLIAEGRLGEIIERLWDQRRDGTSPLLVRILVEALRLVRRVGSAQATFGEEAAEREAFDWQTSRIIALEGPFHEYLRDARQGLRSLLPVVKGQALEDTLRALDDLRVDAGRPLLHALERSRCEFPELVVNALRWARGAEVAHGLRTYAHRRISMGRRAHQRRRNQPPEQPSIPATIPYAALLRSLRGHPSAETERFLMLAGRDWDPVYRVAAFSSFGWWEPILIDEVTASLESGRRDLAPEVRHAARAALARLGERAALHWFRQALHGNLHQVFDAIQDIANEGLTLLWPDLDRLADAENPDVAQMAREALERLSEELEHTGRP